MCNGNFSKLSHYYFYGGINYNRDSLFVQIMSPAIEHWKLLQLSLFLILVQSVFLHRLKIPRLRKQLPVNLPLVDVSLEFRHEAGNLTM